MRSNTNKVPFLIDANKYFRGAKDIQTIINKLKPELKFKDKTLKPKEPYVNLDKPDVLIDDFKKNQQKNLTNEGFLKWKYIKYFMIEYEERLQSLKNDLGYGILEKSNLEFIFPPYIEVPKREIEKIEKIKMYLKNREENWEGCMKGFGKDTGQTYLCYTLGNIVLTNKDKRPDIAAKFEEKKSQRYANGSLSELELCKDNEWSPKEILSRGIKLLVFMEQRWGIKIDYKLKKEILYLNRLPKITDEHITDREYQKTENDLFTISENIRLNDENDYVIDENEEEYSEEEEEMIN